MREVVEDMVGDMRNAFISWLRKTESQLQDAKLDLIREKESFEDEKSRVWRQFMQEKQQECCSSLRKWSGVIMYRLKVVITGFMMKILVVKQYFSPQTGLWLRPVRPDTRLMPACGAHMVA